MLYAGASDWEGQGRHWAGDQSEGPAVGAIHRVPRGAWCSGTVVRESLLWRVILGDDEGKIVWGQSWALFWRPREANWPDFWEVSQWRMAWRERSWKAASEALLIIQGKGFRMTKGRSNGDAKSPPSTVQYSAYVYLSLYIQHRQERSWGYRLSTFWGEGVEFGERNRAGEDKMRC